MIDKIFPEINSVKQQLWCCKWWMMAAETTVWHYAPNKPLYFLSIMAPLKELLSLTAPLVCHSFHHLLPPETLKTFVSALTRRCQSPVSWNKAIGNKSDRFLAPTECQMANSCENESFRDCDAQWTGWWLSSNPHYFCVLWQNTVDKLIKKTNLALLVGTNSWRDQFIEAITVSAGKAGAEMCYASTCEEADVCVFHMNSWRFTDELCVQPIRPNPSENLMCACVVFYFMMPVASNNGGLSIKWRGLISWSRGVKSVNVCVYSLWLLENVVSLFDDFGRTNTDQMGDYCWEQSWKRDCVFWSPHGDRKVRTWTRVYVGKRRGKFNANIMSLSRSAPSHMVMLISHEEG